METSEEETKSEASTTGVKDENLMAAIAHAGILITVTGPGLSIDSGSWIYYTVDNCDYSKFCTYRIFINASNSIARFSRSNLWSLWGL